MVLSLRGFGDTILVRYLKMSAFRQTYYDSVSLPTPVGVVNLFPVPFHALNSK
jgi:hypothetical protein